MLISTSDVPASERYDYWQAITREHLACGFRTPYGRRTVFRAESRVDALGAVTAAVATAFGDGAAGAAELHRTPAMIRRDEADLYQLWLPASGRRLAVAQDGRRAELAPGDVALADLTRPLSVLARSPGRMMTLLVPRALLPLSPEQAARVTGVALSGREGTGALLSALLTRVAADLGTYGPSEAARISTAALDLVAAVLARRLDAETPPDVRREVLLRQIYAFVDEHLGDPELTPGMIAAAHHVSLRHLHKLFETEECTVAEWIRRRRLDRCRRDLADTALLERPVEAIAARWGFPSAASFSRLFRAVHGIPPGEYRAMHSDRPPK
ncbi:helix-turn-helix domain-containing protein [Actinomadura madurae]|uniref:helix-turn-helix domain-containing protein n=1 Tax=Actinomadura madurae TaxID=1993 RepID=UPI000D91EF28|nr:helix-turn-helix domain-containing protein [Actinomadura madurae]SPT60274.1 Transcriptional activator feaR [Actinomadura madurae]